MPLDVAEIKWLTIWCDRYVKKNTVHTVGGPNYGHLKHVFLEFENIKWTRNKNALDE